ncbi:MAG: hypothetical protein LBM98_11730 [Oscillospiraceae bacterium]|nr:hypothetical protein [Oscillospiraceae bacterium]
MIRRGGFQTRPFPRPGAVRRLCEAPLRPRYVGRYRREAIQCRGDNIRITYRGFCVNPGLLRRISLTTYHKCGGGFAMTGRALPCPHGSGRFAVTWVKTR